MWALEAVLDDFPASGGFQIPTLIVGTFLTFAQFLFITIQNAPSQMVGLHLQPRQVPLSRWIVQVGLFLAVSLSEFPSCVAESSQQLRLCAFHPAHVAHYLPQWGQVDLSIALMTGLCVSMVMGYLLAGRKVTRTRGVRLTLRIR